jgi:hypothetical protein
LTYLEILARLVFDEIPDDRWVVEINVPDDASVSVLDPSTLTVGWNSYPTSTSNINDRKIVLGQMAHLSF